MKKVKLMALGLMVMMIQSVGAVTLPSTSYTPHSSGTSYSGTESVVFGSGTMVSGTYYALGTIDPYTCTTESVRRTDCEDCCDTNVYLPCVNEKGEGTECDDLYDTCVDSCEHGGSVPLDGGLSILLVLALGGGAFKAIRKKIA